MRFFHIACAAGLALLSLTGCPRPAHHPPDQSSQPPEPGTDSAPFAAKPPPPPPPPPAATPPPIPYVPNKRMETARMFNGMRLHTTIETEFGSTATADRNEPESYVLDLKVKVKVPKAHQELEEFTRLNPRLPEILPTLPSLLATSNVSPFFEDLYRRKVATLQRNLPRLNDLVSRHNFYDCETILELQSPETQRRALFIKADMDVDGDGSDSDRVPEIDGSSATFQPFTSYKWPKKTAQPNSFIVPREARLKQYAQELLKPDLTPARIQEIRAAQKQINLEIADLKRSSFLVAATDPYVVLPGPMLVRNKTPFTPGIGDYCVVISEGVLYPAIIGDAGPTYKMGEASVRLCKQINPRSTQYSRPVSDLKVAYLVFPGTADRPFDAPDLEKWHARCQALIKELGGHQGELFVWEDLTKPKPLPPPLIPADPALVQPAPPAAAPLPPPIQPTNQPATPAATPPPPAEAPAAAPPVTPEPAVKPVAPAAGA